MSAWQAGALALVVATMLGSIPFGLFIARASSGADVRRIGSGNIGATNVLRASGPMPAALTLGLDAAKGAGAVLLARAIVSLATPGGLDTAGTGPGATPSPGIGAGNLDDWAGFAAVIGHMFSPLVRLRGGKGVATAAGVLAVLAPALAATGVGIFAVVLALTRIVSLSSMAVCLALPVLAAARVPSSNVPFLPVVIGISCLVLFKHRGNLRRLLRGEEPPLGRGGPRSPAARP